MLDHCSISHKGGIVLWARSFTPDASHITSSSESPVNSLIRDALIEGRTTDQKYEKGSYAVKWTFVNDLELIFVVAYQRILQLTYVEDLLTTLKTLFVKLFQPIIATFVASLHAVNSGKAAATETITSFNFATAFDGWDKVFDKVLKGFEDKAASERQSRRGTNRPQPPPIIDSTPPSDDPDIVSSDAPQDEQQIARNVQALKNRLRGRGGRRGGRGGRSFSDAGSGRDSAPPSDSDTPTKKKTKTKVQRKWGDEAPSESDMASLDFSMDKPGAISDMSSHDLQALVDQASLGTRTRDGLYEVKDWEFTKDASDAEADNVILRTLKSNESSSSTKSGSLGALGSLFARLTGSKVLTEQDLKPVLEGMKQHLMKKNVAMEIADKVCEGVGESLVGKKVGGFQSTNAAVQLALSSSLTRILTPKTSTDLLLSIRTKLSAPVQQRVPYSITFVGVNGVGKSTNLSKVCFWLIQNGLRVLIAACDTFRSGAVEQLRVHVRNLSMLGVNGATDSKGRVELFERGYGKDAAAIAREAITYAGNNDFDVVLIDTAGRMQDNEPLMRALAKLVAVNNPDKIIFVGEALVGNEAVDQLTKFDRALRDFSAISGSGKERGIDGMLVTKWDTVDDKVGAALSMTYVTGQPIIFVGCGQSTLVPSTTMHINTLKRRIESSESEHEEENVDGNIKTNLVKSAFRDVWSAFFDWQRTYHQTVLDSLRAPRILNIESTSTIIIHENIQIPETETEYLQITDFDRPFETISVPFKRSAEIRDSIAFQPPHSYDSCTPITRNLMVGDDPGEIIFIPLADDPTFPVNDNIEHYNGLAWQDMERDDPSVKVITIQTAEKLRREHGMSVEEIDANGALPFNLSGQGGLLYMNGLSDLLATVNVNLQSLIPSSKVQPTLNGAVEIGASFFCDNINCIVSCCSTHIEKKPPPLNVPSTLTSTQLLKDVPAPCGRSCSLCGGYSFTDIHNVVQWTSEEIEALEVTLKFSPDISPCDLAVICRKPCIEVFRRRKKLIRDAELVIQQKLKARKLPRNNSALVFKGYFPAPTQALVLLSPDASVSPRALIANMDASVIALYFGFGIEAETEIVMQANGAGEVASALKVVSKKLVVQKGVRASEQSESATLKHVWGVRPEVNNVAILRPLLTTVCPDAESNLCRNVCIQRGVKKNMEVKQSEYGFGCFLLEPASQAEFIVEYTGELIFEPTTLSRETMALLKAPGILFLSKLLVLLSTPSIAAIVVKKLLDLVNIRLPTWLCILAATICLPLYIVASVHLENRRQRLEATAMGARFAPFLKGKWLANLDIVVESLQKFWHGYPGERHQRMMNELGPFFNMNVMGEDVMFTTEPEHIQQILATDFKSYEKGEGFRKDVAPVLGVGVFNSNGEMWKFHRQMTRPFFTRDRISHFDIFDRHAESAVAQMKKRLRAGYPIDFQDLMGRFTLDSATEFLFGSCVHSLSANPPYPHYAPVELSSSPETDEARRAQTFTKAFLEAQEVIGLRIWVGPLWPLAEFWEDKTVEPMNIVNSFIEPIIAEALEKKRAAGRPSKIAKEEVGDDETMLDHLVDLTDDPNVLRDAILNIMVAGRDTTTGTLTFIIYFLSMYPRVAARLREEVLSKVGPHRRPTYDDVKEMKYLRAVINGKSATIDGELQIRQCVSATTWPSPDPTQPPIYVPAGSTRTDLWGPDAEEFDPERFLDDRLKTYLTPRPFIFLPFNAGPRICLGQQFAYNEMSFILIRLMQNFESFSLEPDATPSEFRTPPEWKTAPGRQAIDNFFPKLTLTMYSGGGLWITAKEAEDSAGVV
ncbi:hypothetical protein VNI00_005883 [Paramarasmius palmivorus]|uniref:Uncharacterized protein n=1 Tax=Paramarasmius palmivorus TaxID=297713 RepID=A0AAW0DE34_9AGAR